MAGLHTHKICEGVGEGVWGDGSGEGPPRARKYVGVGARVAQCKRARRNDGGDEACKRKRNNWKNFLTRGYCMARHVVPYSTRWRRMVCRP